MVSAAGERLTRLPGAVRLGRPVKRAWCSSRLPGMPQATWGIHRDDGRWSRVVREGTDRARLALARRRWCGLPCRFRRSQFTATRS